MSSPYPRYPVPKSLAGVRFDRALEELVPGYSRAALQKLVRRGRVLVDGRKVVRSNFKLRGGEVVTLREEEVVEAAPELEFSIVEEQGSFAVVEKPAGMLTHPVGVPRGGSVSELLVQRFGALPTVGDEPRPGIVHRLDRETSGLMVVALEEPALVELQRQFRERTVEKRYLAVVGGEPREEAFVVDEPLGPVPGHKDRQRIDPRGRAARTSFRVLETWGRAHLVECRPETGRRHQIRVHLASVGLPILDDELYGERRRAGKRLHLHAAGLAFDHPDTGERIAFASPLPEDLQER